MTFPEISASQRTDADFAFQRDEDHHTGVSPLLDLGVGMVSNFVLDYMHLVCLGVVRKLMFMWLKGPLKCRMQGRVEREVSKALVALRNFIPREFNRKPRSLVELKSWKATEFRQFLLYSGPVVLHGKLRPELYRHFLVLSVAMHILLSPSLCHTFCEYAGNLLRSFCQNFGLFYGHQFLVYNVHSLIHLADDAKKYGALDNVSAFPFENYLGKLKKMVRRPQDPVSQIVRRIHERKCNSLKLFTSYTPVRGMSQLHVCGPVPEQRPFEGDYQQYKQCQLQNIVISCSQGDNCFRLSGRVVLVKNILVSCMSKERYLVIQEFTKHEPFFKYPITSSKIGSMLVTDLSRHVYVVALDDTIQKMVLLPHNGKFVAIPQLHSS